jgi:hypothetical protein
MPYPNKTAEYSLLPQREKSRMEEMGLVLGFLRKITKPAPSQGEKAGGYYQND